jgi:hypothetical protein
MFCSRHGSHLTAHPPFPSRCAGPDAAAAAEAAVHARAALAALAQWPSGGSGSESESEHEHLAARAYALLGTALGCAATVENAWNDFPSFESPGFPEMRHP